VTYTITCLFVKTEQEQKTDVLAADGSSLQHLVSECYVMHLLLWPWEVAKYCYESFCLSVWLSLYSIHLCD